MTSENFVRTYNSLSVTASRRAVPVDCSHGSAIGDTGPASVRR